MLLLVCLVKWSSRRGIIESSASVLTRKRFLLNLEVRNDESYAVVVLWLPRLLYFLPGPNSEYVPATFSSSLSTCLSSAASIHLVSPVVELLHPKLQRLH